MGRVPLSLAVLLLLLAGVYLFSRDPVYCIIEAPPPLPSGYFLAKNGIYLRIGHPVNYSLEFLEVLDLRRYLGSLVSLRFTHGYWSIFDHARDETVAFSVPNRPKEYLMYPPSANWWRGNVSDLSSWQDTGLRVTRCVGELPDAPSAMLRKSNLEVLMSRPSTTFLIAVNVITAGYLVLGRVPVEAVSFSYQSIQQREYWRFFTASFAHYDLMHLLFNVSSLYELGALEEIYGSLQFLFFNILLVVITMTLCCFETLAFIKISGNEDAAHQQSIGFSCVLFAWMVVAAVLMQEYCPIFFLPQLCFSTQFIPVPGTEFAIPVNLAPFALLVVTKLIIPRSSFLGHLAGILIGYPLAWGLLRWITPPMLGLICVTAIIFMEDLLVWSFPGYRSSANLADFVPNPALKTFNLLRINLLVLTLLIAVFPIAFGVLASVPRIFLVVLVFFTIEARRCDWLTESNALQDRCIYVMVLALSMTVLILLCDVTTLGTWLGLFDFVNFYSHSLDLPLHYFVFYLLAVVAIESVQAWLILKGLQSCPRATPLLRNLRLDSTSVSDDWRAVTAGHIPFSGRAHVLQAGPAESMPRNGSSRPRTII